jgi:uncharacterized protein (DUF1778 family)
VKVARIELRADAEREALLKRAATLTHKTLTAFILEAASQRAEEVLAQTSATVVPADFFERLMRAFDEAPLANSPLRRAASRLPNVIDQR